MKLGQILLHRKLIVRDQLREALRRQRRTARPMGEILLQMGIVSRGDVIDALMTQPSACVDAQALAEADPKIVTALPRELSRRHRCMALALTDEVLVVAAADPLDERAIEAIEAATGMPVLPLAADENVLLCTLDQKYAAVRPRGPGKDPAEPRPAETNEG